MTGRNDPVKVEKKNEKSLAREFKFSKHGDHVYSRNEDGTLVPFTCCTKQEQIARSRFYIFLSPDVMRRMVDYLNRPQKSLEAGFGQMIRASLLGFFELSEEKQTQLMEAAKGSKKYIRKHWGNYETRKNKSKNNTHGRNARDVRKT